VRVAAVAGRQVPHWLLAAVVGVEDLQLENALRAAVEDQLLVTRGDGYDFRHGLLREVVDTALLPGERARLHAAYAHALTERSETAGGSPSVAAAELATHWDAAGEPTQALPARVRAGLAAERARAFAEAARHYQRALELWDIAAEHGPTVELDRVEVLTRAGEMAALTGTAGRAVGLLEQALDRVDRAAEPIRAAVLLARLGSYRERAGDEPGALGAFGEA
jgi:predicted ATPase